MGVLGVGFDYDLFHVTQLILKYFWGNNTTLGRSPLANIFAQDASLQPFYDVTLGRVDDLDEDSQGSLVIGSHPPEFAAVENAPKLPQVTEGRWSVLVDGIAVNGRMFAFRDKSQVEAVPRGKLVGYVDTGISRPVIPPDAAAFLYGSIPGSVEHNGIWFLPCQASANLTWFLGYVFVLDVSCRSN